MQRVILSLFCPILVAIIVRVILFAIACVLGLLGLPFNVGREYKNFLSNIGGFDTFVWNESWLFWGIVVIITFVAEMIIWSTHGAIVNRKKEKLDSKEIDPEQDNVGSASITCFTCGKVIPRDSKYCPYCSTSLYVMCPKCGHEYSSQYLACNQCDTNIDVYNREQEERQEILEINNSFLEEEQKKLELLATKWRKKCKKNPEIISKEDCWSKQDIQAIQYLKPKVEEKIKTIIYQDTIFLNSISIALLLGGIIGFSFYIIYLCIFSFWLASFVLTGISIVLLSIIFMRYSEDITCWVGDRIKGMFARQTLKRYIKKHPDDPDIIFIREHLNK